MKSLAAIHESYGRPSEVVRAVEQDVNQPAAGQALVKLVRAVINPSDMGMIGGSYGRLRPLPAIAGREGIGEIVEVGAGVECVKPGDTVRLPEEPGVWRQYQLADASTLLKLPDGLDADTLAMAFINPPTALKVLDSFKNLKDGDWVIQNGASSGLGYFMIQICRARGIKTVNMVRNAQARKDALITAGADVVVDEAEFNPREISELCGGKKPILGLNQIGGESVSNMIKAVGDEAVIVTIGGMTGESIKFPTRFLIFNDLTLKGFWWDKWARTHTKAEVDAVYAEVFELIKKGVLKAPVDSVYPLAKISEALSRASQSSRTGKIILMGA